MVLTKEEIELIAMKAGIRFPELFTEFIQARFPHEGSPDYIGEWAERFKSGDPTVYMDNESLNKYIDSIKKLRKVV